jgi:hypothetical protein
MNDDLLTRIEGEMDERLEVLRGAVDEHDRLAGELRALDAAAEPSADVERRAALEAVLEPSPDIEPLANVVRLPVRPRLQRTRTVSPKVARLMHAPRRPALERAGVARVGAGHGEGVDLAPDEPAGEIDAEAEVYERAV